MAIFHRRCLLAILALLLTLSWIAPETLAANAVFLSNDTAQSPATYVVEFNPSVRGSIDKIRLTFPSGSNPANVALGRVHVSGKAYENAAISVDPIDANTLIVDLRRSVRATPATTLRIELFNFSNPPAGTHNLNIQTLDRRDSLLETLAPIAFTTFDDAASPSILTR
jgi:hypothetical protein